MESKSLHDRLIRTERTINVYFKQGRNVLREINIDIVPFEQLKEIVPPKEDDLLLVDGYKLNTKQIEAINFYLKEKIEPDIKKYKYYLVCGGIYNWDHS